jgi:predicted metalloprotease with PDZ domain
MRRTLRPSCSHCPIHPLRASARGASLAVLAWVVMAAGGPVHAQQPATVSYTLRFPAPQTHYVEVEAEVPSAGGPALDLMMPVWTPGSYLVREYARHVEGLVAEDPGGRALRVAKTRKNRWRVETDGARRVRLRYRVYARQMQVQANWVEDGFAMLNGAATFLTATDALNRPHDVRLVLPDGWTEAVSGLPASATETDPRIRAFRAPDFDTLVDSPILAGTPTLHPFEVRGVPHVLANVGEAGVWDGPRSARDVQRIVETQVAFWGDVPYARYAFLNVLAEAGGGLEHKASTLLLTSRWRTGTREGYLGWLGLVSHEFFHAWNVKRLRPVELGPFEYEGEVYTDGLWVAEGFTDYYGDLLLHRAGLSSRDEYLRDLGRQIADLQTTPGRLVTPLANASFDAWIKAYRADENTGNTTISYYTKGAVVAFLLDARIRAATSGRRSLDDVMRAAYARYAGSRGFTAAEFRRTASEVAGVDLAAWFAHAVDTTGELDYAPALDWFGLRFKDPEPARAPARGWLGVRTRTDNGRLLVREVPRGTPAFDAGVNAEDEIVAIDDFRVRPDHWDARLQSYPPGRRVTLLVSRRDVLRRLEVTLGEEPARRWDLVVRPDATSEHSARLAAWLGAGAGGERPAP